MAIDGTDADGTDADGTDADGTEVNGAEMFRREPDRYLDVGEGEAAYRKIGSGPDVLFVHGWPVSGATFRNIIPYLAEHVTCHVIDLPGAGDSRFDVNTVVTVDQHIKTVKQVVGLLGLEDVALVGHDSGGMISRYAMAGDSRLRSMGLINTEQPQGLSRPFKNLLMLKHLPAAGSVFSWALGNKRIRSNEYLLGGSFVDRSLLDGEFDEFFLKPLREKPERMNAAMRLLKSFSVDDVLALGDVHKKIDVPVQLVWGVRDPFFPIAWAREMVATFPDATLAEIGNARLFSHEERPQEVALALLPTLLGDRS